MHQTNDFRQRKLVIETFGWLAFKEWFREPLSLNSENREFNDSPLPQTTSSSTVSTADNDTTAQAAPRRSTAMGKAAVAMVLSMADAYVYVNAYMAVSILF